MGFFFFFPGCYPMLFDSRTCLKIGILSRLIFSTMGSAFLTSLFCFEMSTDPDTCLLSGMVRVGGRFLDCSSI